MMQDDVPEFVVEIVNVFNILECGRLRKNVIFAKGQGITADAVIIMPKQKVLRFGFIIDHKAARTEQLNLFVYRFKFLIRHKNPLGKQNAPKCAYVIRRGLGELLLL